MTTVTVKTTTPHGPEESTQPARTYLTLVPKPNEEEQTTSKMGTAFSTLTELFDQCFALSVSHV